MNKQIYYLLLNKKIVYTGASIDPRRRLRQHQSRFKKKFELHILNKNPTNWKTAERYYIKSIDQNIISMQEEQVVRASRL